MSYYHKLPNTGSVDQRMYVPLTLLLLSSCTTFKAAKRKFMSTVSDTTYTTVTTTVPRDSAVLRIITDTTTVVHEVRQGRARIIYQRTPQTTLIKADCDSVIVEKKVPQYITKQVWGVDPKYKDQAAYYKTGFFGLLGFVVLCLIVVYLLSRFKFSLGMERRSLPAAKPET
jgi:hypothetical protein